MPHCDLKDPKTEAQEAEIAVYSARECERNIRIEYPDDDVRRRVSRFLNSRHFPVFRDIEVKVDNGAVTLSGRVYTYYEKQVALSTCQRVAGVLSLVDEIAVMSSEVPELANTD